MGITISGSCDNMPFWLGRSYRSQWNKIREEEEWCAAGIGLEYLRISEDRSNNSVGLLQGIPRSISWNSLKNLGKVTLRKNRPEKEKRRIEWTEKRNLGIS